MTLCLKAKAATKKGSTNNTKLTTSVFLPGSNAVIKPETSLSRYA